MNKLKAVIFYTYLPPWRIDVFNEMEKLFDLKIVFLNTSSEGFQYNKNRLSNLLKVPHQFWDKGIKINGKVFRTGIIKYLKNERPEVVFTHEYSPTSILLSFLKKVRLFRYKLIITTSDNLTMAEAVTGLKKRARKFVLSTSYGIIVYSNPVKQFYSNNFPHLNVEICPNIQKPQSLLAHKPFFKKITDKYISKYDLSNSNIILFIGRLVHVKGLDLLINAFSKIKDHNYKLVIIGEGQEKENLDAQIKRLGITDKVIMPGFFDGSYLYAWYDLANFFVLPSRYEPFGAVVNESLIYGCPVLASKYIGALEFISQGKNGFVFDPLNKIEFEKILLNTMQAYKKVIIPRKNLMLQSFEQYIKVFKTVLNAKN
jgi:glycosyltransferase involved in cell wall biosynthesis